MKNFACAALSALSLTLISQETPALTSEVGPAGSEAPYSTMQPSLGLTPLIQTGGLFDDLGKIRWFAGGFAPRGYSLADGSELSIAENEALFSKLGTAFGGDGRSTFKLPDLRGRAVIGAGQSTVDPRDFQLGTTYGSNLQSLNADNIAPHTHMTEDGLTTSSTGSGLSFNNMQSSVALNVTVESVGTFTCRDCGVESTETAMAFAQMSASNVITRGELLAQSQLLPIIGNEALFSLFGTIYGGDGRTTFALPDTAGRLLIGNGQGPGLSARRIGERFGANTDTMSQSELPTHKHADAGFPDTTSSGGSIPTNNVQQSVGMTYLIALTGAFPFRDGDPMGTPANTTMLGEVALFTGDYAPRAWAEANGQLLPIASNQALFSILGTEFGGDGRSTFGLPDLRGRTAIGTGFNPELGFVERGQRFGTETIAFTVNELPEHSHAVTRVPPPAPIPLPASGLILFGAFAALGGLRARLPH